MGRLSFSGNISLDGYMNDADGNFDWSEPSEEIHQFWNDFERTNETYIYGRKLYETMVYWETAPSDESVTGDYGQVWRGAEKIVVSSSLPSVSYPRTTLWRSLDLAAVATLKETQNVTIGGPTLANQAMELVDELNLLLYPVVVGGGTRFFGPTPGQFALSESRVFGNGAVHLRYVRAGRTTS